MYPAHTQLVAKCSSPSIGDQRATGWVVVRAGGRQDVRAGGWQEGVGELRLGDFPLHFRLLCLVTVVLEPDLDLCGAMRLSFAREVCVFFYL